MTEINNGKAVDRLTTRVTIILSLLILVLLFGGISNVYFFDRIKSTASENRKALLHLCNTSAAVADALDDNRKQIQIALNNGYYDSLIKRGIATEEQKAHAIALRDSYARRVRAIRMPGNACEKIGGTVGRGRGT